MATVNLRLKSNREKVLRCKYECVDSRLYKSDPLFAYFLVCRPNIFLLHINVEDLVTKVEKTCGS